MTQLDRRELLERVIAMEQAALAEVHDRYYPRVYRYVALRVGDRATAEDLSSEVFVRLLAALRDGRPPRSSLRGWLFGVASNVVSNHHRRGHAGRQVELDAALPSARGNPEHDVERILAREGLLHAMDALTDDQRDVLALRFGAGLPIRLVADAMGRSEGAIKQLQLRAVSRLGTLMRSREDALDVERSP